MTITLSGLNTGIATTQVSITATGLLKGSGAGTVSTVVSGTDKDAILNQAVQP